MDRWMEFGIWDLGGGCMLALDDILVICNNIIIIV